MVYKEGNTTPLLVSSEQQHGNMVSLILPLESISKNPGLPGRMGKIFVKKFSLVDFSENKESSIKSAIYTYLVTGSRGT